MTQQVGTLITSYSKVMWGSMNLSHFPMPDGTYESLIHSVEIDFDKGEQAPMAKFRFNANPTAFETFAEIKATMLSQAFTIEVGYIGGNSFTTSYRYAGMRLTTGHDPKLEVTGVSVIKGPWTDNKISYTMENAMTIKEFPQWLLKNHCKDMAGVLKFEWVGQAAEVANQIQIKHNQVQRTCHVILVDVMRQHGFDVQLGDTAFDGTIVISYSPALAGELESDKPSAKGGASKPGKRNLWVIGPGLMENLDRQQSYNVGQNNAARNASTTSSNSYETDAKDVVEPDTPQAKSANSSNSYGTTGPANPPSTATGTVVPDPEAEKKRAAFSKLLSTTITFTCEMLPRNVGMKPRDLAVVPSLKGPGAYLEDWELTRVAYKQQNGGGIRVSVTGRRPYTGGIAMLDSASEQEVKSIVEQLTTPDDWMNYYFVATNNKQSMPLAR